jgi:hypothetical protein
MFTIVLPFAGLHRLNPNLPFNCFDFSSVFAPEFLICQLFGLGVIPFMFMLIIYINIFIIVLEKIRSEPQVAMMPPPPGGIASNTTRSEFKSIKKLLLILGFTGIAWLPFTIVIMMEIYTNFTASLMLRTMLSWLTYLNSGMNPLIYTLRSESFKMARNRC